MGDKVHILVISVDLSCCRCRQAIQDHLCQIQRKERNIVAIQFDEKKNTVQVSGPFNPEELKRKLLCKLPKIINCIDIKESTKPKDERKEKFMKKCEEEYEEISKCIEKCKKECEEKCMTECEDKFKCNCKSKCKCKCECKSKSKCECECKCESKCKCKCECKSKCKCECECKCKCKCNCKEKEPPKETPKEPCKEPPKLPPVCPWPPQITAVCCARPCPCFVVWSNNYRCCSCGVESWPGWSGPGWGSGPSWGGRPQPSCGGRPQPSCVGRPQRGCEPSQPPPIILESTPPCSIM